MKKGRGKHFISILGSVVGIVIVLVAVFFCLTRVLENTKFLKVSEKVQRIPGMMGGFVPQGVTYIPKEKTWLVCGYMDNGKASRIYRLDGDGNHTVLYLRTEDGLTYKGHAGGITAAGNYVYISNASKLLVLHTADVIGAKDGDTLDFIGHIDVPCRASFCSSDGKRVYVGDYHAAGYNTAENHTMEATDGTIHHAVTYGYKLSDDGYLGIADPSAPDVAFSTCDKVQGFAFVDGKAILSCSGGFSNSELKVYSAYNKDGYMEVNGKSIPLIMLDGNSNLFTLTVPQRSEDLECRDGVLYIGFEACARKFGFGLIPISIGSVRAIALDSL